MNTTTLTVNKLKENNEDFEWYPTTKEITESINKDILKVKDPFENFSILDVGAGNGSFFSILDNLSTIKEDYEPGNNEKYKREITKYAIEKSDILTSQYSSDIFILGTDFHEQTFIDKKVNIIFCNPPYTEYREWAEKLILESNCQTLYLVIPDRWENQPTIKACAEKRKTTIKCIGSFDFVESEFRKARAKIDVLKIDYSYDRYSRECKSDPFDVWFETNFKVAANERHSDYESSKGNSERLHELVQGQNIIERLEELYLKEFSHLLTTYKKVGELDSSLLKELKVSVSSVRASLKMKIEGLKSLYWKELFDNLNTLTDRLTKKSRDKLLSKLTSHTSIDFTANNAYSIVLWAIKNANFYMNDQMKEVYLELTDPKSVKGYKSNKHFTEDGWRYEGMNLRKNYGDKDYNKYDFREKITHYKLDYRVVFSYRFNFEGNGYSSYYFENGLNTDTHSNIQDIFTIAKNLGFDVKSTTMTVGEWEPGKKKEFYYLKDGELELFGEIRAYINGNIHCKFNQKFMKKFNVEAGRLNGWLKTPQEASDELNVPIKEIQEYYGSNAQLIKSDIKLLGA